MLNTILESCLQLFGNSFPKIYHSPFFLAIFAPPLNSVSTPCLLRVTDDFDEGKVSRLAADCCIFQEKT